MRVAADLVRRGYKVALPFGEDWDYDLIVERDGRLERVQVKHATSDGRVVEVRCYSVSSTGWRCTTRRPGDASMSRRVNWAMDGRGCTCRLFRPATTDERTCETPTSRPARRT